MAFTAEERQRLAPYLDESSRKRSVSPWFRGFLRYDPAPDLKKIKAPVLALTGAKDIQVKAGPNICGIRKALEAGGNPDVTAEILPRLNHLFQTADTGNVDEYARIEETFAPSALNRIASWIVERTQPGH
jgi:fermentation-respiration switch protein FrsA (DUF1100 family)